MKIEVRLCICKTSCIYYIYIYTCIYIRIFQPSEEGTEDIGGSIMRRNSSPTKVKALKTSTQLVDAKPIMSKMCGRSQSLDDLGCIVFTSDESATSSENLQIIVSHVDNFRDIETDCSTKDTTGATGEHTLKNMMAALPGRLTPRERSRSRTSSPNPSMTTIEEDKEVAQDSTEVAPSEKCIIYSEGKQSEILENSVIENIKLSPYRSDVSSNDARKYVANCISRKSSSTSDINLNDEKRCEDGESASMSGASSTGISSTTRLLGQVSLLLSDTREGPDVGYCSDLETRSPPPSPASAHSVPAMQDHYKS